ncbi:hypothetical protein C8R11_107124 [Nitrosomonas aestuarii]|nr:hypothetical protein C8R11_107124 [Nitrosomonas aestuarii]
MSGSGLNKMPHVATINPMSRPIRIEFSGAFYHVTTRGDRRENIYDDDIDRERFLTILGQVIDDFN